MSYSQVNRSQLLIERSIAIFQIIIGTVFLYLTIVAAYDVSEMVRHMDQFLTNRMSGLIWLIELYHYHLVLSFITLVAGITLILGKKIAWVFCLISAINNFANGIIDSFEFRFNGLDYQWLILAAIIVFLTIHVAIITILLTPHFLNKFKPGTRSWILVITVSLILIWDKLFLT